MFGACLPKGTVAEGESCSVMDDCAVTDCASTAGGDTCREICQGEASCPADGDECAITEFNTQEMGGNDQLRLTHVSGSFLLAGTKLDKIVDRRIEQNRLPILLYLAGQDRIIDNESVEALVRRSAGPVEVLTYADQTHSIQFDATDRMVVDMARWLGR